ncbi:Putative uncharacterized protein [Moritella viscosa]|uniref:Uncharacterized protein n=1 Tax=Moritella viscosa TaxID=80854 RepID=A0ABY1HK57_9GAMM|nr:Putative uncharacterized protein [Moritella viscosa]SGZ07836.1 Putative uncharacterized protein [Moritella viscosa]SGZ17789.1 Putative uncharacterized protein [Moritella viscosa]SHO28316.1 Putative uncharacterized protein [Moritella viscosa]
MIDEYNLNKVKTLIILDCEYLQSHAKQGIKCSEYNYDLK